jgi:LysM repeat protein
MTAYAFLSAAMLALASAAALPQVSNSTCKPSLPLRSSSRTHTDSPLAGALPCGATSTVNHTIVAGDTLTTLATQYNSGICDIASYNNIANPNLVEPGQVLSIPTQCTTPDNTSCIPDAAPLPTATCAIAISSGYIVKSGDTLSNIATNYNITLDALVAANQQIENIDLIFPGELVNVPVCAGSQCLVKTYNIQSGDTFFDLANKAGTTVGNIEGVNPAVDPTKLAVGQQILFPNHCKVNNGTY